MEMQALSICAKKTAGKDSLPFLNHGRHFSGGSSVKFKKEITLREKIRITTRLVEQKKVVTRLHQEMVKEDGTVATEIDLVFGLFDLKTRRLIEPTPEWMKAIGIA
jgi:acyl-CoA thioesterase FadM